VNRVLKEQRACKGLLVHRALPEIKGQQDFREQLEIKVPKVSPVTKGRPENRVRPDFRDPPVNKEPQAFKE